MKRLVLNNLFYSSELVENLLEKFRNIEYLKILPFNFKNDRFQINFTNLTALRKLEMTLGFSDDIEFYPPAQLKELTLSISKMASDLIGLSALQYIYLRPCTSLEYL